MVQGVTRAFLDPVRIRGKGDAYRAGKEPAARKREKRRVLECIFKRMFFLASSLKKYLNIGRRRGLQR
jgi:hypothetical protein